MSIAREIKDEVGSADPGTFFSSTQFHGPRAAVESALSRLASDGHLRRVRRGLYWKGVKSRFGTGKPRPAEIALAIAKDRAIGPTGWTASHALGLSTQLPAVPEFAVV